jgi:hypothetical protein
MPQPPMMMMPLPPPPPPPPPPSGPIVPQGWTMHSDETDTWYVDPYGESHWELPGQQQ